MRIFLAALTVLASLSGIACAAAGDTGDFAVYAGPFSILRDPGDRSIEGGIEYRMPDQFNGLRPTVGLMGNTDGAVYGYAGIYWDLPLGTEPFVITPGVAVGAYDHGHSKDLGSGLEFRDTLEATYKFPDGQRLGAQLTHMSNASIGHRNPGVESAQIIYSHPVSW